MPKKIKLLLKDLNVQSFQTSSIKGGATKTIELCEPITFHVGYRGCIDDASSPNCATNLMDPNCQP